MSQRKYTLTITWTLRLPCKIYAATIPERCLLRHCCSCLFPRFFSHMADAITTITLDTPHDDWLRFLLARRQMMPAAVQAVHPTLTGKLPFRGPPISEIGLGKRRARTPAAEGRTAAVPTSKPRKQPRKSTTVAKSTKTTNKASGRAVLSQASGLTVPRATEPRSNQPGASRPPPKKTLKRSTNGKVEGRKKSGRTAVASAPGAGVARSTHRRAAGPNQGVGAGGVPARTVTVPPKRRLPFKKR